MTRTLFISHAHRDGQFVQGLMKGLGEFGIGVLSHTLDGGPAEELPADIAADLHAADAVLIVLGEETGQNRLLMSQVGEALLHHKKLLTVLGPHVNSTDVVPSVLRDVQPFDLGEHSHTELCAEIAAPVCGTTAKVQLDRHSRARRRQQRRTVMIVAGILAVPVLAALTVGLALVW